MSYNKNVIDIINALGMSFIVTIILLVGKDVIQILNDKIEKLNKEIERLNSLIDQNNNIHTYHLKEIEASYKTNFEDFEVKYNTDMLAVNANIVSRIATVRKHQDITIEKMFNIQNKEIGEFLDNIEELNLQMSGVQFNISSIMGHRDEDNTSVNNELFAIRSKIKELEAEMPVCVGSDGQDNHDIFVNPKNVKNMFNFGRQGCCDLNIDVINKFPTLTHIMISFYNKIIINGIPKALQDLTSEDKAYIKGRCEEFGITLINSPF
jgi:hypothetical protein